MSSLSKETAFLVLILLCPATTGFTARLQPKYQLYLAQKATRSPSSLLAAEADSHDLSFNPSKGYRSVDIPRATYCANHFGACSLEEIEDLHDNLHKERLQHFVFGNTDQHHTTKEAMEHLVLEEELEMQLHLLRDELDTKEDLFPKVEEAMMELPHLKDPSAVAEQIKQQTNRHNHSHEASDVLHKVEDAFHNVEHSLALKEIEEPALWEEINLETIVMCAVVLALALGPEVFHWLQN